MAQRRMFSPDIVCSDEFLEMPPSTQTLYFHLGMKADDDGFIQPKMIMRILGSVEDDLKILIAKRFLIRFETGVVVIKHWLIHNMIRQDRYKATRFQEEKKSLKLKENNAYTELEKGNWQPNGNQSAPQVRLGKVRLGKDKEEKDSASYLISIPQKDIDEFVKRFDIYPKQVISLGESLKLYCESKGKRYSNYKSFLLNAIKRDFKERVVEPPRKEVPEITEEQRKENIERLKEMKAKLFKK